MNLSGKQVTFRHSRSRSDPYRVLILLGILLAGLFLLRAFETKEVESPFEPTAVPTRTAESFAREGETHFIAGDLNKAIEAYRQAVAMDPGNAQLWAELARIQTYSSALLTTDEQKYIRLQEALESINQGLEADPDNSTVHAIRAFVLDWNANPALVGEEWTKLLTESEQEAIHALALDNQNTLALAYYAEILIDSQQLIQAENYIGQALERDPSLMDVHRVNGYVRESLGYYGDAIRAYQQAVEIAPNLTFLYIRIGVNYRQLKQYDLALEYFAKAADINEQLGVQDPVPYLAIGKTYSQMGEFFVASRNVRKVLEFDPTNPDIYGTLGMIYFKSRNYEGAIPALKCSTYGCSPEDSCLARIGDPEYCADETNTVNSPAISGMPLTTTTVVYYYTYGSVLAGMHRPHNNYCEYSLQVMQDVRSQFSSEPVILQIVEASEEICAANGATN